MPEAPLPPLGDVPPEPLLPATPAAPLPSVSGPAVESALAPLLGLDRPVRSERAVVQVDESGIVTGALVDVVAPDVNVVCPLACPPITSMAVKLTTSSTVARSA